MEVLQVALSEADVALGRLDGICAILPNPDLFVAMYVKQEAVLSSQIEGTQASLTDILQFESDADGGERPLDVEEVVNYVNAMNYGLSRLKELPLSMRLVREIHEKLLDGVRGNKLQPGLIRSTQNWIGAGGCTLKDASYVPPPSHALGECLGAWEKFLHVDGVPPLIIASLAHAQFETIHPFLDGNGRLGRLVITFLLCEKGILSYPLLYLSHYLKKNRVEYYDRLQAIRDHGSWEQWILFFLKGVKAVAEDAVLTAKKIIAFKAELEKKVREQKSAASLLRIVEQLYDTPVFSVRSLEKRLDLSYSSINTHVGRLQKMGVVAERTGQVRNRSFRFASYLVLFPADSE